ncbi:YadA family autotransporter adhesin, partial [Burkholderia territorii]
SLSTSTSTGISTAQSGVNSLSTGLSTTNSNVTSLSTGLSALATSTTNTGNSTAAALGGGATYDATTGTVTAPSYTMYDKNGTTSTVNSVGSAINSINSQGIKYFHANSTAADSQALGIDAVAIGPNAVANNPGDVALGSGSITAAANPTVSANIGGTTYSFAGATPTSVVSVGAPGAERQITNVAAGRVTATSTDAVNGSQLYATNAAVSSLSTSLSNTDSNLASLSTGVGAVANEINNLNSSIAAGNIGPVQRTATPNQLTLVAQGGTGLNPGAAQVLTNVAPGQISATSTDAVNGSQLYAFKLEFSTLSTSVGNSITQIYNTTSRNIGTGTNSTVDGVNSNASGSNSTATGQGSNASGSNSTATGQGSTASGANSTAMGQGAMASGSNSVALGAGSVASDPNTVSAGSPGNERRLTNIAPGVNGTDAVNMNQLNGAISQGISQARSYTDTGVAAALAIPSIPNLNVGEHWAGAAVGNYGSATAIGVGVAYQATQNLNIAGAVSHAAGSGSTAVKVQAGYRW